MQGIRIDNAENVEERRQVAETCPVRSRIELPILIDTIDNKTEGAYVAWPRRLYIVGVDGKIAYSRDDFSMTEMAWALEKVLAELKEPPQIPAGSLDRRVLEVTGDIHSTVAEAASS